MRGRVLVLAALAFAGCGGGDDDAPQAKGLSGDPIPLADYIKRADKICQAGRVRARKALTELQTSLQSDDGELTDDDVMMLNAEGAEQVRPLVRKIQQLPPPDSKREEADAYTRAMQETLFALDDAVEAYRDEDRVRTENALEHNRDLSEDIIKHARAVGFKVCGTEFSS
jgi:hypothetical protein